MRLGFVTTFFLSLCTAAIAADATLEFRHFWKGKPLVFDEWLERDGGEKLEITRLAYLVSLPVLTASDGEKLEQKKWFGFIDAREKENKILLGDLPARKFTGIGFSLGLDPATNAADPNQYAPTHPLNPAHNGLHWSWQGSYIFLAIEGRWKGADGKETGFSYHLGNDAMLMNIALPAEFDGANPAAFAVEFHLDRALGDPKSVPIDEQASTHGRAGDDLATALKRNVERSFSIRPTAIVAPVAKAKPAAPTLIGTAYRFTMPGTFPMPNLPLDFPMTNERVELGRRLFHEKAMSNNGTINCAACHSSAAFSDARKFSIGSSGKQTPRHGMPLVNLAWKSSFFWDGRAPSLRDQALVPIQDEIEMHETLPNVVAKLGALPEYADAFAAAFGDREITPERIGVAIEQFVLSLTSFDSRFDRAMKGNGELTAQEKRGFELFFTEYEPRLEQYGADCFHCHGGAFFSDHGFHNNGLDSYLADIGLERVSGRPSDRGKFSTPSLRNVALTAPYMHDGRFSTLEEVVDHYAESIQPSPTLDPNLSKHQGRGIPLSREDRAALVAFLKTLSDPQFEKPAPTR